MNNTTFANVKSLRSDLSAHIQIEYVKTLLDQIDESLGVKIPSILTDECKKKVHELRGDIKASLERLKRPRLRLGVAGTTASGKSTLSNTILGREFLPMDVGETSTGVVQIFHDESIGDEIRVVLHAPVFDTTEKAELEKNGVAVSLWEPWERVFDSDDEVRRTLHEVMLQCRDSLKLLPSLEQCHFEIYARIMPGVEKSLIKMPQGVEIEIVDLPGIKQSNDTNVKVVQDVLDSLTVVVLIDYVNAAILIGDLKNNKHALGALLKEINDVIDVCGGDASNVIFALNRIDLRNQRDPTSVETVIEKLSEELRSSLNLDSEPMIIPLCTALAESIQTAFGADSRGNFEDEESLKRLVNGFNYAKGKRAISSRSDEKWIQELDLTCSRAYNAIEQDDTGSLTEDLKQIRQILVRNDSRFERRKLVLERAREKSGFNQLLTELNQRTTESFASVVIRPLIIEVWSKLHDYVEYLKTSCGIATDGIDRDLNDLITLLNNIQNEVDKTIDEYTKTFGEELREMSRLMKDKSGDARIKLDRFVAKSSFFSAIGRVRNLVERIEDGCSDYVITPIQTYLGINIKRYKGDADQLLLRQLSDANISQAKVNRFCRCISPLHNYAEYDASGEKTFDKNSSNVQRYNEWREAINECNEIIPDLLASYYSFQMQINRTTLESVMKEIAETMRTALVKRLRTLVQKDLKTYQLVDSLVPSVDLLVHDVDLTFPCDYIKDPASVAKAEYWTEHWTEQVVTFKDGVKNTGIGIARGFIKSMRWIERCFGGETDDDLPEYSYTTEHHYDPKVTFNLPTASELIKEWETSHANARSGLIVLSELWLARNGSFFLLSFQENCKDALSGYRKQCDKRIEVQEASGREIKKEIQDYHKRLLEVERYEMNHNEPVLVDGAYFKLRNLITKGLIDQYYLEVIANNDNNQEAEADIL